MEDKLIKIDRNGTKYYLDERCPRCGGGGGDGKWMHTGWTCWECGGSGLARKPKVYKVYTDEYEAKLAERRAAKRSKYEAEHAEAIREHQLAMQMEQERIEREKALEAARKAISQYVGEVGEKVSFCGEFVKAVEFQVADPFGRPDWRHVYTFKDTDGNVFTWFTSSGKYCGHEYGEPVEVTGTVKGHKEYDGEKQTNLLRVKAVFVGQEEAQR